MMLKQFFLFTATLLLNLLCDQATRANASPAKFVYRADFRKPSNIFINGFQPLGDNDDLMDHITGKSCATGSKKNTAFVATSIDEDVARDFGFMLLWVTPGASRNIYVYKIRATESFYDVQMSLRRAYRETGTIQYLSVADEFKAEREWVAYHGIPPEQIESASAYAKGQTFSTGRFVRTDENRFYVPKNTRGSIRVFPIHGLAEEAALVTSNSPNPISACFASCPATNSARFASSGTCKMSEIVYRTSLSNEKGSFWDPVKRGHSEGLLPWKEVTSTQGLHMVERPEDCTIDTGNANTIRAPLLKIRCPKNRFYGSFSVYLKGGMGQRTLFHTKDKGLVGRMWTKSARQIRFFRKEASLEDKGYRINEVFASEHGKWWSEIHIYPVYPKIRP